MTNIKSRVDNSFKKTAEFFTPHEVGEYIYACCQFPDGPSDAKIYDPTCWEGDLLLPFYKKGRDVYGQDISEKNITVCRDFLPEGTFYAWDTLKSPHFQELFDIAVLNPPYLWNEFEYIDHALKRLKDSGRMFVLLPGWCLYANKYQKFRQKYLPHLWAVFQFPKNLFIDSPISVNLVIFSKKEVPKKETYFFDCSDCFTQQGKLNIFDIKKAQESQGVGVSHEDIQQDNDWSVWHWKTPEEPEEEEESWEELQKRYMEAKWKRLKAEEEFEKLIFNI